MSDDFDVIVPAGYKFATYANLLARKPKDTFYLDGRSFTKSFSGTWDKDAVYIIPFEYHIFDTVFKIPYGYRLANLRDYKCIKPTNVLWSHVYNCEWNHSTEYSNEWCKHTIYIVPMNKSQPVLQYGHILLPSGHILRHCDYVYNGEEWQKVYGLAGETVSEARKYDYSLASCHRKDWPHQQIAESTITPVSLPPQETTISLFRDLWNLITSPRK